MRLEYANYDVASNEAEFKENLIQASKYSPSVISVLPSFLKVAKSNIGENTKLATVIDFPFGVMDSDTRNLSVANSIKNGAQIIEMVVPSYYLCNRKYDKIKQDIIAQHQTCLYSNVEIRYILEYRVFSLDVLCRVAQLLLNNNIMTIVPSTGQLLDDISDNLIASAMIQKKVPALNIIANGNIWNDRHVELIKSQKLYGFRTYSLNSLQKIANN